jgi:two-component system OmpR family sensor kinase
LSRLPIRVRLALAFALAMAVVLAAVGGLLYVRLGNSLQEQVDDNLDARAQELTSALRERGTVVGVAGLGGSEEQFAQVLDADGSLLVSSAPISDALVTPSEAARARELGFLTKDDVADLGGEPARLLVVDAETADQPVVLVVGASLEDREEALDGLLTQLLVVGPLALLLSSLAGYFLARAALRPVDAMRRQAARVSSDVGGQRLPLPRAQDEIRRLGETLNEMLARLEAGIARERRFVGDASHELRTPLALLQTELELALRRPRSHPELEQALQSAAEEVDRLVRLAEDLLVLARADDGRLPLAHEKHIVREVVDAVAGRYDSRAAAAGRAIEVASPDDAILTGDRLRLEQALGNLVDNALRHGSGAIRLEARQIGGLLELRVSDDGTGFPPEFLPHAFERFSRADVARAGSGAGLGLAIVDAIARAHGGTAQAGNKPDGGAMIVMRIPGAATTHLVLI